MSKNIALPSRERLHELFEYSDGQLLRRKATKHGAVGLPVGFPAGRKGRIQVYIDGRAYYLARLVWVWHCGEIPEGQQVDHMNGDRQDNRIENLRLLTGALNMQNQSKAAPGTVTGVLGVNLERRNGKYRARIMVDGKSKSLGYYGTVDEAEQAYIEAKRLLHPGAIMERFDVPPPQPKPVSVEHFYAPTLFDAA